MINFVVGAALLNRLFNGWPNVALLTQFAKPVLKQVPD
jgi:hypothetical protein